MSKIDNAVAWAVSIAGDDTHGYDQGSRWGPDYDCSSLLIQAWENAGVPVKTNGATYTGNMVSVFLENGFTDITSSITLSSGAGLKKGDIVWKSGHTEMVYNDTQGLVGASINENGETTGGVSGDQTGGEIRTRTYYNYPWTTVLRYTASDNESEDTTGDVITGNRYLSMSEMQVNAKYIYNYFRSKGWTIQAISAILGNMQVESTINAGLWQSLNEGNTSGGYGLVQWTPATKVIEWLQANNYDIASTEGQCARIIYEVENKIQWIAIDTYNYSFEAFTQSTDSVGSLARAFMLNYERPADQSEENQDYRASLALDWYSYLISLPTISTRKRKKFNFILFNRRRRTQWIRQRLYRK